MGSGRFHGGRQAKSEFANVFTDPVLAGTALRTRLTVGGTNPSGEGVGRFQVAVGDPLLVAPKVGNLAFGPNCCHKSLCPAPPSLRHRRMLAYLVPRFMADFLEAQSGFFTDDSDAQLTQIQGRYFT